VLASGLALVLVLGGGAARAQQPAPKDQASELAAQGDQLVKDKRYDAAVEKFKEAARLDPDSPAYVCNIGMAYYALVQYARAHLHLSRCHRANGAWPAGVEDVFKYVDKTLAQQDYTPVTLRGTPQSAQVEVSYYAGEGASIAPVMLYLPVGMRHEVTVHADGYEPATLSVDTADRAAQVKVYALTALRGDQGGGATGEDGRVIGGSGVSGASSGGGDIVATPERGVNPAAKVAVGVGAGLLVLGGVAYGMALHYHGKADGAVDPVHSDNVSKMNAAQYTAAGLAAAGAVALGVGIYLWVSDSKGADEDKLSVSAAPTSEGGMVFLNWTN
jgi:hypothetical protein